MKFTEIGLKGAYLIEPERIEDERGFFARTWCRREFEGHGLNAALVQCSTSFSKKQGTLRGMHFQASPHAETKLVRCTSGSVYDVIIDLRPDSATFKQHIGIQLSAENLRMLYIPEGFAHGFQTLEDDAEVFYQMTEYYNSAAARGVRWDDPAFSIEWPRAEQRIISQRDTGWPDFII